MEHILRESMQQAVDLIAAQQYHGGTTMPAKDTQGHIQDTAAMGLHQIVSHEAKDRDLGKFEIIKTPPKCQMCTSTAEDSAHQDMPV